MSHLYPSPPPPPDWFVNEQKKIKEKKMTSNYIAVKDHHENRIAIKELEEKVLAFVKECETVEAGDARWLAIAKTDIEKGFLALRRAIYDGIFTGDK